VFGGMVGDLYGVEDDARPPIVLLHGQSFSRKHWTPVLAELTLLDPGRRVLALDLPGYGESPAQLPHSNVHLINLLRRANDEAGFDAPVMVGHSSSGGLVVMYAAAHPVSGAVDVDAIPTDLEGFAHTIQDLKPQIYSERIDSVWSLMVESFHLELLEPATRDFILADMDLRPDALRSYWEELLNGDPAQLPHLLRAVSHGIAAAGVPVLIVAGSEPGEQLEALFGPALPQVVLEVWPRSGHFPHLAHARRFAERLAATASWRLARSA
jgi:pimeloyl-ACP methyl ester carboxylesterase